MAAAVHTGPKLETKTNCQKRAELSDQAEFPADSVLSYEASKFRAVFFEL